MYNRKYPTITIIMPNKTKRQAKTQPEAEDAGVEDKSDFTPHAISLRLHKAMQNDPFSEFLASSKYMHRLRKPGSLNFTFGKPHEMALPGYVEALQRAGVPQNQSWFAYKTNQPSSRAIVSAALKQRGLSLAPEDIFLTNGAFAGLSLCIQIVAGTGDEVIIISPPWLGYRPIIYLADAVPVTVMMDTTTFDLDLDAIANAITERTRAIIINSPHNPTGKIYPATTLESLARLLTDASHRYGKPIYLISDEAYSRILFDNQTFSSPTEFYPFSFLVYTYSKTLMSPGQRLGYIALPPTMPNRKQMRQAITFAQYNLLGWCFPSALMQHALADLEKLSLDMKHLQRKRDWMVQALQQMGYQLQAPEGTFYLLVHSPTEDDFAFAELLARHNVFVLPGKALEIPGYFRLTLTATEDMISRALPKFQVAIKEATHSA